MQKNNIKISIIVPVYNVEKYMKKCLDSLVNQTYSNIEIICINDGSPDNSLQILQEYEKKDNRIKIINQENQGVSVARNTGIDNATGEYIMFVDSDDWLELNTFESLIKILSIENDIDIIQFRFKKVFSNTKILKPLQMNPIDTVYALDSLDNILRENVSTLACNKIFSTNLIKKRHVRFQRGIKTFEDYLFIAQLYEKNPKIKIISDYYYNYYNNQDSVCNLEAYRRLMMHKEAFLYIEKLLKNEDIKQFSYSYYLLIMNYLWQDLYFSKYKKEYLKELIKTRSFIPKTKTTMSTKLCDFHLLLAKYHLSWWYWKLIRPIGKYCIVLPYRKIKQIVRRNK